MAPEMQPVTRSKKTSSFTWYGDSNASILRPLSQWPDLESSNGSSADDFSDVTDNDDRRLKLRGTPAVKETYETDVGDCDDRRRFRGSSVKVSYDSDSCLTPRSRRTLRRTLPGSTEPWPSVKTPSKPSLDTIFSPTHEILHPLQSLRLERSLSDTIRSAGSNVELGRSTRVTRTSVTFESFMLSRSQSNASEFDSYINPSSKPRLNSSEFDRYIKPSPKPRFTPVNFKSYTFPEPKQHSTEHDSYDTSKPQLNSVDFDSYTFPKPQRTVTSTLEEEKLEQKQSLIQSNSNGVDSLPLSTVKEEEKSKAPNIVVIIVDAEKKLTFVALDWAINVAVRPGDEIIILGVLKHILSPMGFKMLANTDPFYGVNKEVLLSEVNKTTETFESKLANSGRIEECEKKKVKLTVRIAPGARVRTVVVRELTALEATYAIFDRKVMRSRRYYGKHLSCHAVRMRKNGRSVKTITQVPHKLLTSDISSVSSMSTDRASLESPSPTFWRRITNFRSSRRSRTTSPRSSPGRIRSVAFSPSAVTPNDPDAFLPEPQDFKDMDTLSTKLKLFHLPAPPKASVPADSYSYIAMESYRKSLPAISVTIPPPICAV